jgi:hypothetical protein
MSQIEEGLDRRSGKEERVKFRITLVLLLTVLVGCKSKVTPKLESPNDEWFVVSWENVPPVDKFGGVHLPQVTLRHHGNIYKAHCQSSYMMLTDPDIPKNLRQKAKPCGSLISGYVGRSILPKSKNVPDKDGWAIQMWPDKDGVLEHAQQRDTPGVVSGDV